MDASLRNQQRQWKIGTGPQNPASEGELLDMERTLGNLSLKKRQRILGAFTAFIDGQESSIHALLSGQDFTGLTIVGAISTLLGQEGVYAQGLWYEDFEHFDWFWGRLENILRIDAREDTRFRGGVRCVWVTTPIAEYAMAFPHPSYFNLWESTLAFFMAPHVDVWPKEGYRPDWWPSESSGLWPGQLSQGETPHVVTPEEDLRRLTELLSVDRSAGGTTWKRLGPL